MTLNTRAAESCPTMWHQTLFGLCIKARDYWPTGLSRLTRGYHQSIGSLALPMIPLWY